jgi:hypothetical protein
VDVTRFQIEILKLLLQVACADSFVHRAEAEMILKLGARWSLSRADMEGLYAILKAKTGLPPPDMELLKQHPHKVLEAARALAKIDGNVCIDERLMINQLEVLLGVKPA